MTPLTYLCLFFLSVEVHLDVLCAEVAPEELVGNGVRGVHEWVLFLLTMGHDAEMKPNRARHGTASPEPTYRTHLDGAELNAFSGKRLPHRLFTLLTMTAVSSHGQRYAATKARV